MKPLFIGIVLLVVLNFTFLTSWERRADIKLSRVTGYIQAKYLLESYGYNEEQIQQIIGHD